MLHHNARNSESSCDDSLYSQKNDLPVYVQRKDSRREGYVAYAKVLGAFFVAFNTWGLITSYGMFHSFYRHYLLADYPSSLLSCIGTTQAAIGTVFGMIGGKGYDLGYYRSVLWGGSSLIISGMLSLSFSDTFAQVIVFHGVCVGLGAGLIYVPTLALIDNLFDGERKLLMNSIVASGSSTGGVIYPVMLHLLLPKLGFAWTIRAVAAVVVTTLVLGVAILQIHDKAENSQVRVEDLQSTATGPFAIFCLGGFFQFLGFFCPVFFTPYMAQTYLDTSETTSAWLLVIGNASSLPGRWAAIKIASKAGAVPTWAVFALMSGAITTAWISVLDFHGAIVFALGHGFVVGASLALPPLVVPLLCPSTDILGLRMGISQVSTATGILIGCPIGGMLSERLNCGPVGIQAFAGSSLLFGALFQLALWKMMAKSKRGVIT